MQTTLNDFITGARAQYAVTISAPGTAYAAPLTTEELIGFMALGAPESLDDAPRHDFAASVMAWHRDCATHELLPRLARRAHMGGVNIVVPQSLDCREDTTLYIGALDVSAYRVPVTITSSLVRVGVPAYALSPIQASHAEDSGELIGVYGRLVIDTLIVTGAAEDALRILAPNVTINRLIVRQPLLHPDLDYSQSAGVHMDLVLQSYAETVKVGNNPCTLTPNNVCIPDIELRAGYAAWSTPDIARIERENLRFGIITLSDPAHYRNWVLGTQQLSITTYERCASVLVNASAMLDSAIGPLAYGAGRALIDASSNASVLIKDRKSASLGMPTKASRNTLVSILINQPSRSVDIV